MASVKLHEPDVVRAELLYLADPSGVVDPDATGWPGRSINHRVTIVNARRRGPFTLDGHGFRLQLSQSLVENFYDAGEVGERYYAELQLMLKALTGAARVVVFAHDVRSGDRARQDGKIREPVVAVHNDYTPKSAPQMVREVLGRAEAEPCLARHFMEINVWRPITGPVYDRPLAVCDAGSIAGSDLVAMDEGLRHEVFMLRFNPAHRWYYFPAMTPEETILIKGFDSKQGGRARYTPHAAFVDPSVRFNPPTRESIEARALLFFDEA